MDRTFPRDSSHLFTGQPLVKLELSRGDDSVAAEGHLGHPEHIGTGKAGICWNGTSSGDR